MLKYLLCLYRQINETFKTEISLQVPYKLAPLIWRRLYDNDRARYTGSASPVKTGGGTAGRFSLTGLRLPSTSGRWWWPTVCLSQIVDGGILTSILIAVMVAAYANILARCHSTSPIKGDQTVYYNIRLLDSLLL
jgi:hypothetical protein